MHRLMIAIQIAACSGSPAVPDATEAVPVAHPVVHGAPGSAIDIIAATADGRAAVTQDGDGNTRLWPTLDGTAEPIVVRIATASELALVQDGTQFLIASLDNAGGLELLRIASDGTPRGRIAFDHDVAIEQLAVTSKDLLALRSDQTIAVIGANGAVRGQLATPAGERTLSLETRGDRAVAIVQRGRDQHVRALDLDQLAWGDPLATFHAVAPRFALSPNGELLAIASAASTVTTVDLVSNKQRVVCSLTASTAQPQTGAIQQLPLGFIDDRTLACFAFGQVSWYPIAGGAPTFVHVAPQPELVAFGGERELSGEGTALGIAAEKSMQYLGYVAGEPTSVHDSPLGLMFLHGSEPPLVLDRALAVKAEIPLAPAFDDALPIDDAHVLRSDPALGKGFELALAEPGIHRSTKITTSTEYAIHFDAAAKLLVAAQAAHVAAFPYDSTHHRFGAPTLLDGPPGRVFVTDPALADGIAAVVVENLGGVADSVRVREYRARDIARGGTASAARSYDLGGDVIAVDRAARAYLTTGTSVQSYVAGDLHAPILVAKLALAGRPVIAPNPEATAAIVLGDHRMILMESDGHVRWSVPIESAVDAGWTEGVPFVRFAAGMATVDARTGALRDRRCGWKFALVTTKIDSPGNAASVCDAE